MKTVSVYKNGNTQTIRLPADMQLNGIGEMEIIKQGNELRLKPVKTNEHEDHRLLVISEDGWTYA